MELDEIVISLLNIVSFFVPFVAFFPLVYITGAMCQVMPCMTVPKRVCNAAWHLVQVRTFRNPIAQAELSGRAASRTFCACNHARHFSFS